MFVALPRQQGPQARVAAGTAAGGAHAPQSCRTTASTRTCFHHRILQVKQVLWQVVLDVLLAHLQPQPLDILRHLVHAHHVTLKHSLLQQWQAKARQEDGMLREVSELLLEDRYQAPLTCHSLQ
jgi:hypothetical protein